MFSQCTKCLLCACIKLKNQIGISIETEGALCPSQTENTFRRRTSTEQLNLTLSVLLLYIFLPFLSLFHCCSTHERIIKTEEFDDINDKVYNEMDLTHNDQGSKNRPLIINLEIFGR